jgi:hypothetical protein
MQYLFSESPNIVSDEDRTEIRHCCPISALNVSTCNGGGILPYPPASMAMLEKSVGSRQRQTFISTALRFDCEHLGGDLFVHDSRLLQPMRCSVPAY